MGTQKECKSRVDVERVISEVTQKMLDVADEFGMEIRDRRAWERESRENLLQALEKHYVFVEPRAWMVSGG